MRQRGRVGVIAIVVMALVVVGGLALLRTGPGYDGRMPEGVSIGGVPVGGQGPEAARQALQGQSDRFLPETIEIRFGQSSEKMNPESLGLRADLDGAMSEAVKLSRGTYLSRVIAKLRGGGETRDVPVKIAVDQATFDAALKDLASRLDHKPRDARLTVKGGKVEVIPEQPGYVMDLEATKANALAAFEKGKPEVIECVGKEALPKVKSTDCAGIDTVLASFKTDYSEGKVDRTHNLAIAIKNINGQVLMPGQTLSLNDAIGERDVSKGYREAPIFVNGEITPSTGGGVCQIASTVYNAALLAGLDIVERHHHSMPVHYAPAGRDATIYFGQLDLRVKNDHAHPVVFLGEVGGGSVDVKIMGHKADKVQVTITRSEPKKTAFQTKETQDPQLPKGKRKITKPGVPGIEVTVTRIVTKNGVKGQPETLHTDTYSAQAEEVSVGTKEVAGKVDAVDILGPDGTTKPPAAGDAKPANGKKPKKPKKPTKPQAHPRDLD